MSETDQNRATAEAMFAAAIHATRNGQIEDAELLYHKILADRPCSPNVRNNLARLMLRRGNVSSARAILLAGFAIQSFDARTYLQLGICDSRERSWENAAVCFQDAIECDTLYYTAHLNLGIALNRLGRCDEAITALNRAIDLDHRRLDGQIALADVLLNAGRLDQAKQRVQIAQEIAPSSFKCFFILGQILRQEGFLSQSVDCFERSITLNPDFGSARTWLSLSLADLGCYEEAQSRALEAVALDPTDARALFVCGKIFAFQGEYQVARRYFSESLRNDDGDREVHYHYALAFAAEHDFVIAMSHLDRAIQLDPEYAAALSLRDSISKIIELMSLKN